jgi:alkylhydroperoxidase family enzyme
LQGEQYTEVAKALRAGDLDSAPISPAERLLLEFVGTLTRHAYRITDEQVQALREVGWNDAQIAEAVYDGELFNLFVRLADAFDIHPPAMMDPDGIPTAVTHASKGPVISEQSSVEASD